MKAPLSKLIEKEYNKLIEIILLIPEQYRIIKSIDGTEGKVSARDIIAYQIGWGRLLMSWYDAGLKGKIPEMPGEGFIKWDYTGLARHFYGKYQYESFSEQIEEFRKVVKHIINIVEKEYQTGNLDKVGVWDWCTLSSGKPWPLSKWIAVNTSSPYKRASLSIAKVFKLHERTKA